MSQDIISHFTKFTSQTSGQEKICRLLQYTSQLICWYIERKGYVPEYVNKLKDLQSSLSLARRCLGLGRSVEHLQSSAVSVHINNPVLRYTITLSRISRALQMFFDNLYLFSKLGLIKLDHSNLWSLSCKFWLYADILNIVRLSYEIKNDVIEQLNRQDVNGKHHTVCSACKCLFNTVKYNRRPEIFLELVKNLCEVWVPVNATGAVKISPGAVAFCGTVSSLLGLVSVWKNTYKIA